MGLRPVVRAQPGGRWRARRQQWGCGRSSARNLTVVVGRVGSSGVAAGCRRATWRSLEGASAAVGLRPVVRAQPDGRRGARGQQ
ncbi:hypothetical protein ACFPM0_33430 [Pseudonocardia sulfidoxydans]|uniref:hypothetical protein n=1 Tax=Pseudonocardia sulfidoxydans TaxID=54011 RepID=UPI00360A008C